MQEINKTRFAGFFVRLGAVLIDGVIVSAALCLIRIPVWVLSLGIGYNPLKVPVLFRFTAWDILLYIFGSMYYVLMICICGATIGKKLLRLKVVGENGSKPAFLTALYRETVGKYLSSVLICIGFLIIGADKEKRGLHDILCDTRVIYDLEPKESGSMENTYMHEGYKVKPKSKSEYLASTYMPPTAYSNTVLDGSADNSLNTLQDENTGRRPPSKDIDSSVPCEELGSSVPSEESDSRLPGKEFDSSMPSEDCGSRDDGDTGNWTGQD